MRQGFDFSRVRFDYRALIRRMEECGYHSLRHLAADVDISSDNLANRLKNKRPFKQWEILALCQALDIRKRDIPKYFFKEEQSHERI